MLKRHESVQAQVVQAQVDEELPLLVIFEKFLFQLVIPIICSQEYGHLKLTGISRFYYE